MSRVRVAFVVGKGRSGSTLLDDMLGTLDGVMSLGELRQIWDVGMLPGYACACGDAVTDCPVWGDATRAVAGATPAAFANVAREQASVHSWWRMPALLAGARPARARRFGAVMGVLYQHLADATGATTLVDSSKWPAHVGMLDMVPGIDPWVIHLVRDPRAVAHSYTRHKNVAGQPEMPRFGPAHSALSWNARNLVSEVSVRLVPDGQARRIRYEDLVERPRPSLEGLAAWLGTEVSSTTFVDDRTLHLEQAHLVGGNPRRFDRGDTQITPDHKWVADADPTATRIVAALTRPLRRRYGYDTRGRA